jgi:hypothetical protein
VHKVPTSGVVNKSIAVVIYSVVRNLAGVVPDVGHQVSVVNINSTVEHCHNHVATSLRRVPGSFSIDILANCSCLLTRVSVRTANVVVSLLTGVLEGPLLWIKVVVRSGGKVPDVVWLSILDIAAGIQYFNRAQRFLGGYVGKP